MSEARDNLAARFRVDGRVALVTGAGRGIGRSVALALAQVGAEVWLVARTQHEIETAANEIRTAGCGPPAAACDVTDATVVRWVVAAIPTLDILINNSGMNIPEPFVDVSEDQPDHVLNLNVKAAFVDENHA
jgi:NAD(P)-dependent dehydrogenase (short-subunit alcohol dehydrogenase family)